MAREFKETSHLKTDLEKYGENYERIFGKKCDCHKYEKKTCDICQKITGDEKDKDEANA